LDSEESMMEQQPPSPSSEHKKARHDLDTMDVDSSEATETSISLTSTTEISDRDILMGLRPIVLQLEVHNDSASLCTRLETLNFLQLYSSINLKPKEVILKELSQIYLAARSREAENCDTHGDVAIRIREAAIEIRNAILHSKLERINEESEELEMKVYQGLVPDVQVPGGMTRVVIRPEDQTFWDRCIELSLLDHPVCGVGNPGIGKTVTTLYLLQQLVMNQKEPVVYTIRKSAASRDIFYEFVPVVENEKVKDITVKVYELYTGDKESEIPSMKKRGAFYVVDPGKYKGSCDDTDDLFEARFIMAASNDDRHWGANEFTKFRGSSSDIPWLQSQATTILKEGKLVYGCLWTGRQVILAKPYISKLRNLDDNEILRRVRIVGGSLRDILVFEEEGFKRNVGEALNLDLNTVQKLAEGRCQFSFKPESPSSLLIGICPKGLNGRTITLKSDYVEEQLANKYLKTAWYAVLDEENSGNRGNLFEAYVRVKFSQAPVIFTSAEARESLRDRPSKKNEKKNYKPIAITVGSARNIVRVSNMIEAVRTDETLENMYYSKNEREPLIDMIFRVHGGFDCIQATIFETHNGEAEKIRTLKTQLGLGEGMTLRIFYAVPWSRYEIFVTSPVNPLLEQSDLGNVLIYHVGVSAKE
jgi:hypothetical protein